MQRKVLGRGLGALIPSIAEEPSSAPEIEIGEIRPNPRQPRHRFDEAAIAELAASIKEHGLIQPIVVRRTGIDYELIAGERRLRAAREVGLTKIPAIVRASSDGAGLELALIENLQREDLNPLEEALAYRQLIDEFELTQDELASRVGKSRSAVTNALRLLQLPDSIQGLLELGSVTAGHARAILAVQDEEVQLKLAQKIVEGGHSVRQAEALAKAWNEPRAPKKPLDDKEELARSIGRTLGARVKVKVAVGGKGRIEIHFASLDELERLRRMLSPAGGETDGVDL